MALFGGGLGLLFFALWAFCIIDVITTPKDSVRNLPKLLWLMVVILLVDIGSLAWLVAGRNWNKRAGDLRPRSSFDPAAREQGASRRRTTLVATNPDDDEEFLAGLKARAEEQRRRAREADEGQAGPATGT